MNIFMAAGVSGARKYDARGSERGRTPHLLCLRHRTIDIPRWRRKTSLQSAVVSLPIPKSHLAGTMDVMGIIISAPFRAGWPAGGSPI